MAGLAAALFFSVSPLGRAQSDPPVSASIAGRCTTCIVGNFADLIRCAKGTYPNEAPYPALVTCQLAPGRFEVDQPIVIQHRDPQPGSKGAGNIAISGSSDPSNPTLLIRGRDLILPMMQIGDDNFTRETLRLGGITIQNLTFCGGSRRHQSNPTQPDGDPNNPCPVTQVACESTKSCIADVFITNSAPGQLWAALNQAPYANRGTYNITITNARFEDSPASHNIFIAPMGPGQSVSDVLLSGNIISSGGVQMGAFNASVNFQEFSQCDNWSGRHGTPFADDPSVPIPRNIRFQNNTFFQNEGAISGLGRYVQINGNTFNGYKWPTGGGGGAIESDTCSDEVRIVGNHLNGNWQPGSMGTSGMELYSRNLTVQGNYISGYSAEAIGAFSTYHANISGNHVWGNNASGLGHPEIKLATRMPWPGTCYPNGPPCNSQRDSEELAVNNNDNVDPSGRKHSDDRVPYGIFFEAVADGSTDYSFNDSVRTEGQLSFTPGSAHTEMACNQGMIANSCESALLVPSDPEPRTIAIFPEADPPLDAVHGMNLGTRCTSHSDSAPYRCVSYSDTGIFRFGATDPNGPSNIRDVEVFIGLGTNSDPSSCVQYAQGPGCGGPFLNAPFCHFIYFPQPVAPAGTSTLGSIYLDKKTRWQYPRPTEETGDYRPDWFQNTAPIGSDQAISNDVCTIYLTTSSVKTLRNGFFLYVDMQFLNSGTYYMYEIAVDRQGRLSPGNGAGFQNWSLWGYWVVGPVPQR
jgi:hypothetical protein